MTYADHLRVLALLTEEPLFADGRTTVSMKHPAATRKTRACRAS